MKNNNFLVEPEKGVLVNLSGRSYETWSPEQLEATKEFASKVVDVPYPNIPSSATQEQIGEIMKTTLEKVIDANPKVVMCMGENITCHNFVKELEKLNIQTVATVTKPMIEIIKNEDGTKKNY